MESCVLAVVLLLLLLLSAPTGWGQGESGNGDTCPNEGAVRIVSDGLSEQFGRVELCNGSVWGTVCDDGWDDTDAAVVCKQLQMGYINGFATSDSAFGVEALRPIFLDQVDCNGAETSIVNCSHDGFGQHDCSTEQYAGVACVSGIEERCLFTEDKLQRGVNVSERFKSQFGTCEPYDESSRLCNSVYNTSKSVFIPSFRAKTQRQLATKLDTIILDDPLHSSIPQHCVEDITSILCHYFFPPCGAGNATYLPTTVCSKDCVHVRNVCGRDWDNLQEKLESHRMGSINCFSTKSAIHPLPSCCTAAGIDDSPPTDRAVIGGVIAAITVLLIATLAIFVIVMVAVMRRRKDMPDLYENSRVAPGELEATSATIRTQSINIILSEPERESEEGDDKPPDSLRNILFLRSTEPVSIVEQLKRQFPPNLIIKKDQITKMDTVLGEGEFGVVYMALYGSETVAVKTLKGAVGAEALLTEGLRMRFFDHRNVLGLIGVCLPNEAAPYIIMPYMANGSLQQYLKSEQEYLVLEEGDEVEHVQRVLSDMCLQIAQGMEYLTQKKFVHRNLATRNCMVDSNLVIKISDFGCAVDLNIVDEETVFRQDTNMPIKLPLQWLAPESLLEGVYSEKSDVWSYGVTCWEVFSGGREPPLELDEDGERQPLEAPVNAACPPQMHNVMGECWEVHPDERLTFTQLVTFQQDLARQARPPAEAGRQRTSPGSRGKGRESSQRKAVARRLLPKQKSADTLKKKLRSLKRLTLNRTRSKTAPVTVVENNGAETLEEEREEGEETAL